MAADIMECGKLAGSISMNDEPGTLDPFWIFIILGTLVLFVLGCIAVFVLVTR